MCLTRILIPVMIIPFIGCTGIKSTYRSKQITPVTASTTTPTVKTDTTKKSPAIEPYNKVITSKALTKKGIFIVHQVEDKFYFELPASLLSKDIIVVNRISKGSVGSRPYEMLGFAGDAIGQKVIQFVRQQNKVFIKLISFDERGTDSSNNGLISAVNQSNLQPIVASFDIKAITPDSTSVVIDMSEYLNSDNELLFFGTAVKKALSLGEFQKDKSLIESVRVYPENVEIKTLKTYGIGYMAKTYELNSSVLLLPALPMAPRYWDQRVGYFIEWFKNFDKNPQGVDFTKMITRWRIEPRKEDVEKYLKGELVEPVKPIVYYIDPATPRKWVPYLIQGVSDWQKAFEKAGFKNAIYAKEVSSADSTWSLEDARFNAIVYKPSFAKNASGPNIHDPRTGEIIETHIDWYHNVLKLLHDWYMIQVGPNDVRARKMQLDDSLMGQLIRFVASHEVGHTLGLMHNFGASSSVPVEKLRDKKWVEENGFCPSIMDYARFNYVAQPEDSIGEKGLFPRIGVYDEWAIEWGYKWLPQLKTEKDSRAYMNKWIIERTGSDKSLWYGSESAMADPRCQSEDLGDDPVKAGVYGILNLQRVMNHLTEWTKQSGEEYESLKSLQQQVVDQYARYLDHAAAWIGGTFYNPRTSDEKGAVFAFPSKKKQKNSIQFLQNQLFKTPAWLLNKHLYGLTGIGTSYDVLALQKRMIERLVSNGLLGQFEFSSFYTGQDSYSADEMLTDLESGICSELIKHVPIDMFRRNLQKAFVIQMINVLNPGQEVLDRSFKETLYLPWTKRTDVHAVVKGHLSNLLKKINAALPYYTDNVTRFHLMDLKDRIDEELKPERNEISKGEIKKNAFGIKEEAQDLIPSGLSKDNDNKWKPCQLWSDENELYER